MTFDHPLLVDLAAFIDGQARQAEHETIEAHLARCAACRVRVRHAGATPGAVAEADLPESATVIGDVLPRLRPDARQLREPAAGQLWRLRWQGTAALGVIVRVDGDDVAVCPVTVESWMADDYAIVVTEGWSPLRTGIAVWVGLETVVPLCTLDRDLGDVDALDQIAEVRRAFRKGVSVPETVLVGPAVIGTSDERTSFRHQLAVTFHALADAAWAPSSAGATGPQTMRDLLAQVPPEQIAQTLGLDRPSTFALLGGERQLSEEEAARLAELAGVPTQTVLEAVPPVPPRLLRALSHPRHRALIEQSAREKGHDEAEEMRQALAELLPVAARRAGDEAAPLDWNQLVVDRYTNE